MIEALFSGAVVTVVATPETWDGRLYPEEEVCVARAVSERRREFTAGRLCAREALARLGIEPSPLLVNRDRAPVWPSGVAGSISHHDDCCAVAVARCEDALGIGLDVEGSAPLDPELVPLVCTTAELERLARLPRDSTIDWAKLVFSAKECVYKCYHPLMRRFLEFHDVYITVMPGMRAFTAELLRTVPSLPDGRRRLCGRFTSEGTRLATGIVLGGAPVPTSDTRA